MARLALCPDGSLVHLPSLPPSNSEFNYEVPFLLLNQQRSRDAVELEVGNETRTDLHLLYSFFPRPRAFSCSQSLIHSYKVSTKDMETLLAVQLGEHDTRQEPRLEFPCTWAPVWRGRCQGRPDRNTRPTPDHRRAHRNLLLTWARYD